MKPQNIVKRKIFYSTYKPGKKNNNQINRKQIPSSIRLTKCSPQYGVRKKNHNKLVTLCSQKYFLCHKYLQLLWWKSWMVETGEDVYLKKEKKN